MGYKAQSMSRAADRVACLPLTALVAVVRVVGREAWDAVARQSAGLVSLHMPNWWVGRG
jgi:hypothetical protein